MGFDEYKHQRGLTLYEILVASAISAIVATTIGSLFIFVTRHFQTLARQSVAQQELQLVSYHLRSIFGQSLNKSITIKKHSHSAGISKAPGSPATLSGYECSFWGDNNCGNKYGDATPDGEQKAKVVSIELQRVAGFLNSDFTIDEDPETAYVYFIEPFSNKPGVLCLIFDLGAVNTTNMWELHSKACKLSDNDVSMLEVDRYAVGFRLLGLDIKSEEVSDSGTGHKLVSFTLHTRYFLSSSESGADRGFRYCSSTDQSQECETSVNYKDIDQKVQVGLRNNIYENWPDDTERVLREGAYGNILFYKIGLPTNSYLTRSKN